MAVDLSTLGGAGAQFFDNNGVPLAGGKLYSYAASTTTPKATYTSSSGNVPHTNPIILDSSGRVPSGGEIWLTSGEPYKFVLETPTSILLGTWDNIYGYTTGTADASSEVQTATAGQTLFVLNSMAYNPGTNTLAVYIDGVNQVVNNSYIETNATSVTFVSGLHEGAVVKFSKINIGATDANVVSYEPGFLGSVATTVADKLQQYVSVKDFGAVGDGVADDTTAIQDAINYAAPIGKSIFVPAGQYLFTDLTLPQQHGGIEIFGEAYNSEFNLENDIYRGSVLVSTQASGNIISCDGGAGYSNRGIRLRDLSISVETSGFAIYLRNAPEQTILENLTILNKNLLGGSGVCLESCWVGTTVRNCVIRGVKGGSNIGLKVFNAIKAGGFVCENSSISQFYKGVEFGAFMYQATIRQTGMEQNIYGIWVTGGENNLTLDTCHFEFNEDIAIYADNSQGIRITRCSFYRNAESASGTQADIYVAAGPSNYNYNLRIQDCYHFGLSSNGTFIYNPNCSYNQGVIDNNIITIIPGATSTTGLNLASGSIENWQVTNNVFDACATPYVNAGLSKQFSSGLGATNSIRFPAVPILSSDPNTLDDYEEGTWTPVLGGDTGTSGQTYDYQQGYYLKIGKTVYFTFAVKLINKGTVTAEAILSGLPFTIAGQRGAGGAFISDFENLGINVVNLSLRTHEASTQCYFRHLTAAASSMTYPLANNLLTNTTMIHGGGFYSVA